MNDDLETTGFELEVVAWLHDHPEFFTRHPALAENLQIPHPCQPAVSLLEYQNRLLRERCRRQHDKLLEFVSIARDNGRLAERVQRLALGLLNGRSGMAEFLRGIEAILRDEFKADEVVLCLSGAPTGSQQSFSVRRLSTGLMACSWKDNPAVAGYAWNRLLRCLANRHPAWLQQR